MNSKQELFSQIFKSLAKTSDSFIHKDELVAAFAQHDLPLSERDLQQLFSEIDKDLDNRLSFEELRLWFFQIHALSPLDSLFYYKLKAFGLLRHLRKAFSKTVGPLPESQLEKSLHSGLLAVNFGQEPAKYASKLRFSLEFNENGGSSDKFLKDLVHGIALRFRLEKGAKNPQAIFEEFQKNCKGLILVSQNLNKRVKEVLKELNFSYFLHEDQEICLLVRFSDNLQKFLFDFQEAVNGFLQKYQKTEGFRLGLSFASSIEGVLTRLLESPIAGLISLLQDSRLEVSGYISKLAESFFEISKEKLNNQLIEDALGLFLLLKTMKFQANFRNLTAEDLENCGCIELLPESSFFLGELPKFELPKMPIIKKFYAMLGNGFEGRVRVDARFENVRLKLAAGSEGVLKVFDRFFKVQ